MTQDEYRKRCKNLKRFKKINYKDIAKAVDINENSFYNFISGRKANLGYTTRVKLDKYLSEKEK